jgi:uncharacterized protein (DUF305 family)
MKHQFAHRLGVGLVIGVLGACSPAAAPAPAPRPMQPYTEADVRFLTAMIPHHGQAILISGWAPSHGANRSIQTLTARIVVGQQDDIVLMQQWLRDRGKPVPEPQGHTAMDHSMHMSGMLTPDQLAQLDAARGTEFDRLFLTFMIQHHQGALKMVQELQAAPGAAQDDFVFKLSSDMNAEQITEIERMRSMLATLPSGENRP